MNFHILAKKNFGPGIAYNNFTTVCLGADSARFDAAIGMKRIHSSILPTYVTLLFTHFQEYITYYIFWSKFLLVEMIPYITIIVLNSMILGKIWKSTQFRKRFVVSEGSKCRDIRNEIPEHHTLMGHWQSV